MVQIRRIKTPKIGLLHTEKKVQLEVNGTSLGSGTLHVCKDSLSWRPTKRSEGVVIPWTQVSFLFLKYEPSRFVVMELSESFEWEGVYEKDQRKQGDNVNPMTELSLIPSVIDSFDPIFKAMLNCYCNTTPAETKISGSKATPTVDDDGFTMSSCCWYLPKCPFRQK